jgi:hypothetical protein
VAIKRIARLQPQRVARRQSDGQYAVPGARLQYRGPKGHGVFGLGVELEAVLAGVTGAAHQHGDAVHLERRALVGLQRAIERRSQRTEDGLCGRALQGEDGHLLADVFHLAVGFPLLVVIRAPVPVLRDVGGIDHDHVVVLRDAVDQDIVDHAPVGPAQGGILHVAGRELRDVVGGHPLEVRQGARPLHGEVAHVRHVEETRARAHGLMLLANAGVLDGHGKARERGHFGTLGDMPGVQRSVFDFGGIHARGI